MPYQDGADTVTVVVPEPPFPFPFARKSVKETVFPFAFLPFFPEKQLNCFILRLYDLTIEFCMIKALGPNYMYSSILYYV